MYNHPTSSTTKTQQTIGYALLAKGSCSHSTSTSGFENSEQRSFFTYNLVILNLNNYIYSQSSGIRPTDLEIKSKNNFQVLEQSFLKHHGTKTGKAWGAFREMANIICRWNPRDSFVQVNRKTKSLKFSLLLGNNISLNVTYYFEEQDDTVFFSLFHEKELLVSDSSTMDELNRKIHQIEKQDNE